MKSESIVFLGLSQNQVPFLEAAKTGYFKIIGVDKNENAIGSKYCDRMIKQSITESNLIYDAVKHENVIGVLSEQTDNGSATLAFLNEKLQLRGLRPSQLGFIADKLEQRKFLKSIEVIQPNFAASAKNLSKHIQDRKTLVKPRFGQSSIGVHLYVPEESIDESNLYEEYIDGLDYSVDGYISEGVSYTVWCKKIKYNNSFVDKISFAYSQVPKQIQKITSYILSCLKATDVFFHFEFRKNGGTYYLIEVHLRGGGSGLCTHIASYISNTNTPNLRVNMLTGKSKQFSSEETLNRRACTVFGDPSELDDLCQKLKNKLNVPTEIYNLQENPTKKISDGTDREACAYIFYDKFNEQETNELIMNNINFDTI